MTSIFIYCLNRSAWSTAFQPCITHGGSATKIAKLIKGVPSGFQLIGLYAKCFNLFISSESM